MTDDVSKLPAFPAPVPQGGVDLWGTIQWLQRDRDAYKARVEALVKTLRMVDPFCDELHHDPKDFHSDAEPCPVRARIDALLAACERGGS